MHTVHTEGEVWASELGQREKVLAAKPGGLLGPLPHMVEGEKRSPALSSAPHLCCGSHMPPSPR